MDDAKRSRDSRRDDVGLGEVDVEEGVELPTLMGWAGGHDYRRGRARLMEEIAEELGPGVRRKGPQND